MGGLIFHNECSPEFCSKYKNVKFVKWEKKNRLSYNDERFYMYLEYLKNSDLDYVMCTDLYDVEFYGNVLDFMSRSSYDLFLGSEKMSKSSSKWMVRKCREMDLKLIKEKYAPGTTIYNAGIIGGKKDKVIELFEIMVDRFSTIDEKFNANMPVFNWAVERMNANILTGSPLHNRFRTERNPDKDYIKHK
jgi:hypothetical protein